MGGIGKSDMFFVGLEIKLVHEVGNLYVGRPTLDDRPLFFGKIADANFATIFGVNLVESLDVRPCADIRIDLQTTGGLKFGFSLVIS